MRTSKRTQILEAATRVVEREGVKSVTFDSVAAEAGLTKGGLLYHFASRDDLVQAIHEHLADEWEAQMAAAAGKPADQATPEERLTAYSRISTRSATRAELLFMLEGSTTPGHAAPWDAVMERWAPSLTTDDVDDQVALDRFIARLAADGLWLYESLNTEPVAPELRRALAERIAGAFTPEGT
ncbi:TetR/AcrR family transcriptional regulator [Streptomyces cyaneofuscatus]|uniref:TetR/AcrR family transcriptional regulator n=1 Tax=Streptomyces cyaneofuscatus TaxID=66883 RepID=UPI002D767C2B|nr:TetR/AcrR family transcriptional regulator [Streptomyces cyaneofuscatus]WRO11627.1 TetR/AcrR family transcriptional regulator [Streptomyces cyaneofuscatus]